MPIQLPQTITWEVWKRLRRKNKRPGDWLCVAEFSARRWQFALKLKARLVARGYEVVLRQITVSSEERIPAKAT
jgi:hypothetical protein